MSLLPEILDLVVDHLHDDPATLETCCVVSKSWVPRTQRHLFAHVEFDTLESHRAVDLWMKAFPDTSNSPAHYTRALTIRGIPIVTAAGIDVDGWIRTFHNVVHLHLDVFIWGADPASLAPSHRLSSTVRSLRLGSTSIPPSEIFSFVCSFPLLEDLALPAFTHENGIERWATPSTSPRLTGSLEFCNMLEGIGSPVRRLLDLPSGPNFTKTAPGYINEADLRSTTDLVSRCSDTLEYLDVISHLQGMIH
jgi:hypothetical protein